MSEQSSSKARSALIRARQSIIDARSQCLAAVLETLRDDITYADAEERWAATLHYCSELRAGLREAERNINQLLDFCLGDPI